MNSFRVRSQVSYLNRAATAVVFFVSSFFRMMGLRACRFHPTCSAYSAEAFQKFSFFRAFFLTLHRLGRCHPYSAGGYDPLVKNGQ